VNIIDGVDQRARVCLARRKQRFASFKQLVNSSDSSAKIRNLVGVRATLFVSSTKKAHGWGRHHGRLKLPEWSDPRGLSSSSISYFGRS